MPPTPITMFAWSHPTAEAAQRHPAIVPIVRPRGAATAPSVDRYIAGGLAEFRGPDPLAVPWLFQGAGHASETMPGLEHADGPDAWRTWIGQAIAAIDTLAGGLPTGIVFDHERALEYGAEGDSVATRRAKREARMATAFYEPIRQAIPGAITGNFGATHTPGIEDQPVMYRGHDLTETYDRMQGEELAGGVEVIPWVPLVGQTTRAGRPPVSVANLLLVIGAAATKWGARRFFLWNNPANTTPQHWEETADAIPSIAAPDPPHYGLHDPRREGRTDFQRLLAALSAGEDFNFSSLLEVLSEWDHTEEPVPA